MGVSIAECAFLGEDRIGCTLHLQDQIDSDALLFGETQSRIIVSAKPEDKKALIKLAGSRSVPIEEIGTAGGENITIFHRQKKIVDLSVLQSYSTWKQAIPNNFKTE